ncbi:glycoside hydrolase family 3 protein [Pholiota molesta]|nr:glycoside hydrolase family 3 protein [Pholiota molesta]
MQPHQQGSDFDGSGSCVDPTFSASLSSVATDSTAPLSSPPTALSTPSSAANSTALSTATSADEPGSLLLSPPSLLHLLPAFPAVVPDFGAAWAAAHAKAKKKVRFCRRFTLDQKVSIATGVGWEGGRCVLARLCLEDSPLGVRDADFVTGFPAGVNAAASWNRALIRQRGCGRNWEGFGADPFLTGEAAEQEHDRTTSSSDIDDRTMHEIYAHPFLKSVMAGVGSMMCSYSAFPRRHVFGLIMSDWSAQHSTISANRGLDMSMPGDITFNSGTSYFGANLTSFVNEGIIPEARVDDMGNLRVLASWYLMKQDNDDQTNLHIDVQDDHFQHVRTLGSASAVLLKNERGVLPLGKKDRSIVLIGSGAGPGKAGPNEFSDQGGSDGVLAMGWGSGTANFTYLVTPLDGIQRKARQFRTSVSWMLDDFNLPRAGNVARKRSAALVFLEADSGEGYITVDGNEGDRKNLTAWHGGDALVLAVAAQNNNTIVVINSVGPLILEPWIEHPNVTAVVWAGIPGQEVGNSLADVLYGVWNPSGRLPYTIAKNAADYGAQLVLPAAGQNPSGTDPLQIPYTDGLNIDYRHFDANNITPRFEFGFGLSYTQFKYSGLHVSKISAVDSPADFPFISAWEKGNATAIAEGSSRAFWLHKPAYQATFAVQNTGGVAGGEIPQLYLSFPASEGEPPSVLRGFTNIELNPGQKQSVTITLSRYDLSIWDVVQQGWRKPDGAIGVSVGQSSRNFKLKQTLTI